MMESDNYHSDPNADLTQTELPAFGTFYSKLKKKRSTDYYKDKYGRSFSQLVASDQMDAVKEDRPSYMDAAAEDSKFPQRYFCAVCGFEAPYECLKCGVRFCCVSCQGVHVETRCNQRY